MSESVTRYAVLFRKEEGARFLSHLDLMATFEYAVRRAHLPVELSEGYSPRPRISAASPIPLGYVGENEILEIALREDRSPDEIQRRLQRSVPPGIVILQVQPVPPGVKPAASRVRAAVYRVHLSQPVPGLAERISALLKREVLPIEEIREGRLRARDIRPLLISLRSTDDSRILRMTVRLDSMGTVRPEQLMELLAVPIDGASVVRERIEVAD